jgi:hypothetical protein
LLSNSTFSSAISTLLFFVFSVRRGFLAIIRDLNPFSRKFCIILKIQRFTQTRKISLESSIIVETFLELPIVTRT